VQDPESIGSQRPESGGGWPAGGPVPATEVDRGVAERGEPGHAGGVEWVSAGGEMFKGGLGAGRLLEDDDVDHDAEAVELVSWPTW
jgi:hypothetical protein